MADPMLAGVSYDPDMGLDPRPNPDSPAWTNDVATPGDEFFDAVNYQGAFGESNWLLSWTALDDLGYIGDLVGTDIEQIDEVPGAFSLRQNYPNPFNPATTIEFGLDQAQRVRLSVYDMLGREIAVLADGVQPAGTYAVQFDAGDLASGMYFYRLAGEKSVVTRSMMLLK